MNLIKWNARSLLLTLLVAGLAAGAGTFNATADLIQCPSTGTCSGTANADVINGTGKGDGIFGGDGDDTIFGGDGNDTIIAGTGDDTIFGGDGDDEIDGDDGDDTIFGGPGADIIFALDGNDKINVFPGDVPNGATEQINCGAGNDTVNFIGFGPLTFNTPQTASSKAFNVTDPVTGGTYWVELNDVLGDPICERLNGLTTLPQ